MVWCYCHPAFFVTLCFLLFWPPQLMPLLVQSLSCDEQSLQLSTLQTMYSLVLDAPDIITRHVTSLVPMLLGLSKFQLSMVTPWYYQSWFLPKYRWNLYLAVTLGEWLSAGWPLNKGFTEYTSNTIKTPFLVTINVVYARKRSLARLKNCNDRMVWQYGLLKLL